ncbi:unnamed protein product [Amoebophrya sp. A25]|nr:unnamed protein product [Amoebophrya sp. A25]|eukprot:GSA25T00001135001.1
MLKNEALSGIQISRIHMQATEHENRCCSLMVKKNYLAHYGNTFETPWDLMCKENHRSHQPSNAVVQTLEVVSLV